MQKLLIATSNKGKFNEMMEVIGDLPFEFLSLEDVNVDASGLEESGETFESNSFIKANFFRERTGLLTLAEDSGILVDALEGELGIKTRRWGAGENATDEEWLDYFLDRMDKEENRGAKFVCNACVIGDDFKQHFEGETRGVLTSEVLAPIVSGIPLSSCFVPDGFGEVYSLMTTQQKNEVSHRGKAMKKLKEFLISVA